MTQIDPLKAQGFHHQNLWHTLLLVGGMMALLGWIGQLLLGESALLWIGLATGMLLTLAPEVSPRMVMRIYQARPIRHDEAPELHQLNLELAERAGLPAPPELYYLPTRVVNAFSVGGDAGAIALTDGLLRRLNMRELAGVMAHECAHIANRDLWVMGLADMVGRLTHGLSLLGLFLLILYLPLWVLGVADISWLAVLLLIAAPWIARLLQLALSRTREFQADLRAVELTGDPEGLASALSQFEPVLSWPDRWLRPDQVVIEPSWLRTHPETRERIDRLLALRRPRLRELLWPGALLDLSGTGWLPVERLPRRRRGLWF